MKLSNSFQVQSVSISVIKHNSVFTIERVSYSTESCKLNTALRFFVKLLSNLNKNINLLTFTQHKLLILKSEFIYVSLTFGCKHILKSLQTSILRDTKKSTKKKMHQKKKNGFLKKCKLSHLKYQTTQKSIQNCRQLRLANKIEVQCKRVKKYYLKNKIKSIQA